MTSASLNFKRPGARISTSAPAPEMLVPVAADASAPRLAAEPVVAGVVPEGSVGSVGGIAGGTAGVAGVPAVGIAGAVLAPGTGGAMPLSAGLARRGMVVLGTGGANGLVVCTPEAPETEAGLALGGVMGVALTLTLLDVGATTAASGPVRGGRFGKAGMEMGLVPAG